MYLKAIEMNGFKSFGEKRYIEFNRGITSVVGPNGSGKSNILDGVRGGFWENFHTKTQEQKKVKM